MHSLAQTNTIIGRPLDAPRKDKDGAFTRQPPVYPWPDRQNSGFKVKLVNSSNDHESISMLVNQRFSSRGYGKPVSHELRKPMNILCLQATIENRIVGTLSVQFDSEEGLPLDSLYQFELDSLRRKGAKLCQFTKLAIEKEVKSKSVLASLFHIAEIWAFKVRHYNYICIEVNPRHVAFYERMLNFTVLSEVRENQQIQAPSVLLGIDLNYVDMLVQQFGGKPELAEKERSFYPYLFSPQEEFSLACRLRSMSE